ncbi:hypothetical protein IQ07DRAFT_587 [Pyrenochaeta sp. DS3sAY3a]|nr:hypothetical protein IQ07DRAFT_587 [Pyrenochaeta sp. DS3sAY3a]
MPDALCGESGLHSLQPHTYGVFGRDYGVSAECSAERDGSKLRFRLRCQARCRVALSITDVCVLELWGIMLACVCACVVRVMRYRSLLAQVWPSQRAPKSSFHVDARLQSLRQKDHVEATKLLYFLRHHLTPRRPIQPTSLPHLSNPP